MRAEGHMHEVVAESRDSVHVVREGALGHLHQRLALGLGAIDRTWLGELKFLLPLCILNVTQVHEEGGKTVTIDAGVHVQGWSRTEMSI